MQHNAAYYFYMNWIFQKCTGLLYRVDCLALRISCIGVSFMGGFSGKKQTNILMEIFVWNINYRFARDSISMKRFFAFLKKFFYHAHTVEWHILERCDRSPFLIFISQLWPDWLRYCNGTNCIQKFHISTFFTDFFKFLILLKVI